MRRTAEVADGHQKRYGILLVALVAAFAVQGVVAAGPWKQVAVTLLLAGTVMAALRVAEARAWVQRVGALVTVVLVAASIVEAARGNVDSAATRIADVLLVTIAPPAIVVGVVRSLRTRGQVSLEAVFGVLCLYILLGMFFAFVYGAIDRLGDGFFSGGEAATVSRCLYYSFTTLTTVGYGDLTAGSDLGHTLSATEALLGQIYLVTVVSVIVGNLGRSRQAAS